jgi:Flp pilus assembly protein TadG
MKQKGQLMTPVPAPVLTGIFLKIQKLRKDQSGVAAIEFILIAPIMFGLYFMLNETASGLRVARKATMVARVMADLATRPANLSNADRDDIFNSAKPILSPYDSTKGSYRLTSIKFDGAGKGYVDWSEVKGTGLGAAIARCRPTEVRPTRLDLAPITVPEGLKVPNTSVVLAEAVFKYKPVIGWKITGEIDLNDKLYMRPRSTDAVTRNGVAGAPCVF